MFRIDTATAAGTLPAPAAAGTPGFFTNGNPSTGVPPTTISADWFNGIQEEILAVLTAAGIAAAKGTNNQLLAALQALFLPVSGLASSFSASGYAKLPGGLILQWGEVGAFYSESSLSVSFPIAFPNACLIGLTNDILTSAGNNYQDQGSKVYNPTTTGMSVNMQIYGGGISTFPSYAYWLALGW